MSLEDDNVIKIKENEDLYDLSTPNGNINVNNENIENNGEEILGNL